MPEDKISSKMASVGRARAAEEGSLYTNIDFSLVLACYKDAPHLLENTLELVATLSQSRLEFEIILVEDGSPDETATEVEKTYRILCERKIPAQVLYHPVNCGRGRSVADGFKMAKGRIVGFIDIDLEHRADGLLNMIRRVDEGIDMVVGERIIQNPSAKPLRVLSSWVYRHLAHLLLPMPIRDTEAGLKVFHRLTILPILDETLDQHWFWDTEIVHRAIRADLCCENYPVIFQEKPHKKSTVRLIPDTWAYIKAIHRYRRSLGLTSGQASPSEVLARIHE